MKCSHGRESPSSTQDWPRWAVAAAQWLQVQTDLGFASTPSRYRSLTLSEVLRQCRDSGFRVTHSATDEAADAITGTLTEQTTFTHMIGIAHHVMNQLHCANQYYTVTHLHSLLCAIWSIDQTAAPCPSLGLCVLGLLGLSIINIEQCMRSRSTLPLPTMLLTEDDELLSHLIDNLQPADTRSSKRTSSSSDRIALACSLRGGNQRHCLLQLLTDPPWRFACDGTSKYFAAVTSHDVTLTRRWDQQVWSALCPRPTTEPDATTGSGSELHLSAWADWLIDLPIEPIVWAKPLAMAAHRSMSLASAMSLVKARLRERSKRGGMGSRHGENEKGSGWVYYVRSDFAEYIKIGQTSNLQQRFTAYRTYLVQPVMYAFRVDNHQQAERQILRHFAPHALQGEMIGVQHAAALKKYITDSLHCYSQSLLG